MNNLLIVCLFTAGAATSLFSQEFAWAKTTRSVQQGISSQQSVVSDANGNVLTTGSYSGQIDADPGTGEAIIASMTNISGYNNDIFIRKLTPDGAFAWVKTIGSYLSDVQYGIAADPAGNVYVTGTTGTDTIDLDPGAGIDLMTEKGMFVIKLDPDGEYIWGRLIANSSVISNAIQVDNSGNVFLSGIYNDTVDFDPGTGSAILTPVPLMGIYPSFDVFLLKLNTNGEFAWAKTYGGEGFEECSDFKLDAAGNIYSTGRFSGWEDFDPGEGTTILTATSSYPDYYIQKLDQNGDFQWAYGFGSSALDDASSIAVSAAGDVFVTGFFQETIDFDPGAGNTSLTATAVVDMFIQKLNTSGEFQWVKQFSDPSNPFIPAIKPETIIADAAGTIYISGYVDNPADNDDPVYGSTKDIFVKRLASNGTIVWEHLIEGKDTHFGSKLALTPENELLISALYVDSTDFDPMATDFIMSEHNQTFITKWAQETVGLTEAESMKKAVYPNPAGDQLTISLNSLQKSVSVAIFEISGQLISSSVNTNSDLLYLDLSGLSRGTYLVSVVSGEAEFTERVVKH